MTLDEYFNQCEEIINQVLTEENEDSLKTDTNSVILNLIKLLREEVPDRSNIDRVRIFQRALNHVHLICYQSLKQTS